MCWLCQVRGAPFADSPEDEPEVPEDSNLAAEPPRDDGDAAEDARTAPGKA